MCVPSGCFLLPPPATPGVGRSPATLVGPAKQANRISRFSRSLPSREQTCSDTDREQSNTGRRDSRGEHCQEKQTNKQNNNNNKIQDNLGMAQGRAEEDRCTQPSQGAPHMGAVGGTEISGTESCCKSTERLARGAHAFQERRAKALWWQ